MAVSWLGVLRNAPALKTAIDGITKTPGAYTSDQNWYNLVKAGLAMLAVCGVAGAKLFTDADITVLSGALAVAVPAVLTILDSFVNLWLRVRKPDSKETLAARVPEKDG